MTDEFNPEEDARVEVMIFSHMESDAGSSTAMPATVLSREYDAVVVRTDNGRVIKTDVRNLRPLEDRK